MILGIYCAGGLGRETLFIAQYTNEVYQRWERIVFVDDVVEETVILGAEVWRWEQLLANRENTEVVIANAEPKHRQALYEKLKAANVPLSTIVAPGAVIPHRVEIGEGCIINDVEISDACIIGANTFINSKTVIGHDTVIGEHCYIGARSFLGGNVSVKDCAFVGVGALLKDRIIVHEWAIIAIGCVVFRSVRREKIVQGNPGKVIGENTDHLVWGS